MRKIPFKDLPLGQWFGNEDHEKPGTIYPMRWKKISCTRYVLVRDEIGCVPSFPIYPGEMPGINFKFVPCPSEE